MKVIALLLILTGCQQASWQEMQPNKNVSQSEDKTTEPKNNFDSCASQTLSVEVPNVKASIKDFQVTTARYPWIKVTKAKTTKTTVTYFLNSSDGKHACEDSGCAEKAGWFEVQNDLLALSEIEVGCMGAAQSPAD